MSRYASKQFTASGGLSLFTSGFSKSAPCHRFDYSKDASGPIMIESTNVTVASPAACRACDPNSNLLHSLQITKFNVANLCCAGEERLIESLLSQRKGIEAVQINIVGRSVAVKHCPVECCTSPSRLLEVLNSKNLGASFCDSNDDIEENDNSKINVFQIATYTLAILVVALFIIGVVKDGVSDDDGTVNAAIFIVSIGLGCVQVIYNAAQSIRRGILDINFLMLVAIAGALASRDYTDASLLVSLFLIAAAIEEGVMRYVRRMIKACTSAGDGAGQPKKATLLDGKRVAIEDVKVGDIVTIRAGELVPIDGIVTKGKGSADESSLTGEATPLHKSEGDRVTSGSILQTGYLEALVDVSVTESTMRRLQQSVMDVQADKGNFGRIVDDFSRYWTPFVISSACAILVIGGAATSAWEDYFARALVVLVLACPCSLVLSAPIPSVCAVACASRLGGLVRGGAAIEKAARVDCVAFDKTGTLTQGRFRVVDRLAVSTSAIDEDFDPMAFAAALEDKSSHPVASAVVSAYCGCVAEFEGGLHKVNKPLNIEGVGVSGWIQVEEDWKFVIVGNERVLKPSGNAIPMKTENEVAEKPFQFLDKRTKEKLECFYGLHPAAMILYICVDDELVMALALADEVRGEAARVVASLKELGLSVCMLTGDHKEVAEAVCKATGIDFLNDCFSRLLPAEKLNWVQGGSRGAQAAAARARKRVMMVGDGVNDAAALAGAYCGVAMGGSGSGMAIAAADVILLSDDLSSLPALLSLCRRARRNIIQNCSLSIVIKIAAIVLAIAGYLNLLVAVLVDVANLLIVVFNGMRLLVVVERQNRWLHQ